MNAEGQERPHRAPRARAAADIFADALEQPSRVRDEFVRRACDGDASLQAEVGTLLAALPEGELVLEATALHDQLREAAQSATRTTDRSGLILTHYRLEEFIGAGGMGEVYRASDIALGRPAAIKLLRGGVDPQLRARLLREAGTNARLEHPAVATFFESGTAGGVDFLAMEYVEGETLRSRLKKGPLAPDEALSMTSALLEALVHAHAAGIVHRDIKPENIMITPGGAVKLLDFGIAKERGRSLAGEEIYKTMTLKTSLTSYGMIVGTLGYMSPEQLRGDPVNDQTDVFAVGAVLYEALTGERAFPGDSRSKRIAAVLSRKIPPISIEGLPTDINTIVQRALARDREERYKSAVAFLRDLRLYATGEAVAILPNTIAILDLENLTKDPDDDWIGSGMAESLTADLGRAEGLRLVPRGRVLKTRAVLATEQKGHDPAEVGLAVGSRWVLTGSFQRMGPSLRLTVRLVEVSTGNDVWTEKIDGKVDDIFEIQDRLATLTADSLNAVLPELEDTGPSQSLDAFELTARARRLWMSVERSAAEQAREHFERAIEIEPGYAPALAGLAAMYAPMRWLQTGDPRDLETSLTYSRKAIEADPRLGEGHLWVGYVRWRQGRFDEALEAFGRSAEYDPATALAPYFRGCCLMNLLRYEEAIAALQQAISLDSTLTPAILCLGIAQLEQGDLDTALWTLEKALEAERDPAGWGWSAVGVFVADCLRRMGRLDDARARCMEAIDFIEQGDSFVRSLSRPAALNMLGHILLGLGDTEAALVAFGQAEAAIRAQPRGYGKGHVLVQALAGRARAGGGSDPFEEAMRVFDEFKFDLAWGVGFATRGADLFQLARAAEFLDRREEARELLERARGAGCGEARHHELSFGKDARP